METIDNGKNQTKIKNKISELEKKITEVKFEKQKNRYRRKIVSLKEGLKKEPTIIEKPKKTISKPKEEFSNVLNK